MGTGRDYIRKGDAFTLKVRRGEGPPCAIHWQRTGTGRDFYTRVPVHQCHALRVAVLAQGVRDHAQRLSEAKGGPVDAQALAGVLAFDWKPLGAAVKVRGRDEAPAEGEVRLTLETSPTGPAGVGVRYWITCPRCARRCGVVYGSRWNHVGRTPAQPVTGCRVCLGLTDESRQSHKCLHWASAVMGERAYTADPSGRYRQRGFMTHERAYEIYMASFRRGLRGLGLTMPGSE
ncbi:hypothetical protein [Deinococcus arenicola]|uniref:Uncharacterized protein n=1 Tax=Deinococcus arenicola TaxID=2994950 RepID=A0ABU4DUI7_9DEIO|nr:hypothetical protein [Deinococcus sp. ZS9-10]MDV6376097.1 hypothetical protein [Deinococcus sp. ZS9-10]